MKTTHIINFLNEPESVFEALCNANLWPEIFPPCVYGNVEYFIEGRQKLKLAALANNRLLSWTSHRIIDDSKRSISFSQIVKPDYLDYMKGTWTVYQLSKGSQVVLEHDFEVKEDFNYHGTAFANKEEALLFYEKATEENSINELSALKKSLERKILSHVFECKLVTSHPPKQCFTLLKKADMWKFILPHCTDIEMLYDDGENQEFIMTVEVGGSTERIRSVRTIEKDTIRYFQTSPPFPLSEHRGVWEVSEENGLTTLRSIHSITLSAEYEETGKGIEELKALIEKNIYNKSFQTMQTICKKLEELCLEK